MLSIILKLKEQKKRLIETHPNMQFQFVDVYHPKLKATIPFLPIRCFRDFYVSTLNQSVALEGATFLSSGSTNAIRARHTFSKIGLKIYAENAIRGFEKFLNCHELGSVQIESSLSAVNSIIISLVPPPSIWPTSSLSAMIQMFEKQEFSLQWFNVEDVDATEKFLNMIQKIPTGTNVIVFGTTFHHLNLIQKFTNENKIDEKNKILKHVRISVIDTGGTKGKTQFLTLEETQNIYKNFYSNRFFSEYGMCELGSQAWSVNKIHDGTFRANDTLTPFAIDLKNLQILPKSEIGFLGFIDVVNADSYGAIITEDLGYVCDSDDSTFKLCGRAPDASIKGCSLRVHEIPRLNLASLASNAKSKLEIKSQHQTLDSMDTQFQMSNFLSRLNKKYWNTEALSDFNQSFQSLNKLDFKTQKNEKLQNKNILLISAANTPISFVYPLVYCALNSAKTFTLKIPSLRANDPMSEIIRAQIIDLFQNLVNYFPQTKFFMNTSRSIENDFSHYDCVFAFGTDETLKTIKAQCVSETEFFGFGDIKNGFIADEIKHSPEFLANICSVWNGRGCLTPVCIFVNAKRKQDYVEIFFDCLKKRMHARNTELLFNLNFMHDHNVLFVQNQLRTYGIDLKISGINCLQTLIENQTEDCAYILSSKNVTVVDLSHVSQNILKKIPLDFSLAGSGFVYILPIEMKENCQALVFRDVFPAFTQFTIQDSSEKS